MPGALEALHPAPTAPKPRAPRLTRAALLPAVPPHHLQHEGPLVAVDVERADGISAKSP